MLSRRGLIGSLICATAIIRTPGLLMPIKPLRGAVFAVPNLPISGYRVTAVSVSNRGEWYDLKDVVQFDLQSLDDLSKHISVHIKDGYPFQIGDIVNLDTGLAHDF